jgi:hypothetical protein
MSERSVDVIIRAKDAATADLKKTEGGFDSLRGAVARFGGAWLAMRGVEIGLQGIQVAQAAAARSAALAAGDIDKIVEAQIRYGASVRDLAGAVPILGGTLRSLMDVLAGGDEILKRSAEALDRIRKAADAAAGAAGGYVRERELAQAETPEEKAAVRLKHETESRAAGLKTRREQFAEAETDIERMKAALQRSVRIAAGTTRGGLTETYQAYWKNMTGGFDVEQSVIDAAMKQRDRLAKEVAREETEAAKAGRAKQAAFDREGRDLALGKAKEAGEQIRRETDKTTEEAARRDKASADLRMEIADRLFNVTHDARERELRDVERYYDSLLERAEGFAQIEQVLAARQIETQEMMNRQREAAEEETGRLMAGGGSMELERRVAVRHGDWRALESRFLHWVPGTAPGGADPAATDRRTQTQSLKNIERILADIRGKEPVVLTEGQV